VGRVADPRSASGEEALTRKLPRSYIAAVTLAYFGLTAATSDSARQALLYLYYYLQDVIHYKKPGEASSSW
jgi:hypothetical protein